MGTKVASRSLLLRLRYTNKMSSRVRTAKIGRRITTPAEPSFRLVSVPVDTASWDDMFGGALITLTLEVTLTVKSSLEEPMSLSLELLSIFVGETRRRSFVTATTSSSNSSSSSATTSSRAGW